MPKKSPKQPKRANAKSRNPAKKRAVKFGPLTQRQSNTSRISALGAAIVDPWSYAGCVPDGSFGTGCFTLKSTYQLATGTGTCTGIVASPAITQFVYIDSGSANATPTFPSSTVWGVPATTISNQFRTYRPIGLGLRASYVGSTMADQGTIIAAQFASANAVGAAISGATVATVAQYAMSYKVLPLRQGASITWRPTEQDDIQAWVSTTQTGTTMGTASVYPFICIIAFGAAVTSPCLQIEAIWRYEGQYNNQTYMAGAESATPMVQNNWYEAAQRVANAVDQILPAVGQYATNFMFNVAKNAVLSSTTSSMKSLKM